MKTHKVYNQHPDNKSNQYKQNKTVLFATLLVLFSGLSSCAAIAGIFKAGMGFGIFIVVAIVAAIVLFAVRAGKK